MAEPLNQEQQLLTYLRLKSSTGDTEALLTDLFGTAPEAMLQAVLICDDAVFSRTFLSAVPGRTARLCAGKGRALFLFSTARDETEAVLHCLRENERVFFRASVSRCYPLPVPMQKIIAEAENNLLDAFVYPNDRIFPCRLPNYPLIEQWDQMITGFFHAGQVQQIQKIVEKIPTFFQHHHLGVRDAVLLWNRIKLHADQRSILPPLEHLELFELVERFHSIYDLSHFLSSRFSGLLFSKRNTASEQFVQLIEYINAHYSEKLELGRLCGQFYISPSYASALFQKEMHMKFSQYVARKRVNSACELMNGSPQLSIAEIGEMVGYRDYFYFTKVFRRIIGCTPTEYKKRISGNQAGP